ncbi:MAG: hypothetical protein HY898_12555 [Deltaproteobacteria bacterium]|nr:hypothetical protein [Deltaproteobacteria bacterium]
MMSIRPNLMHVVSAIALGAVLCACSASNDDSGGWTPGGGDAGDDGTTPPEPKPYPAWSKGGTADDGLARLNEYRTLAGLAPVQGNNDAAHACEGHLDYLIWESKSNGKGQCYLSHTEPNHSNPNYSADNENAGKNSVIACGYGSNGDQGLAEAVDLWINSLYHRLPLLHAGLTEVGFASKQGWNCINYRPGTQKTKAAAAVIWPPAETYDVPTDFVGFEAPCPTKVDNPLATNGMDCQGSGFIVTASWNNWGGFQSVQSVDLIEDATGTPVPLLVWYGDGVVGHDPAKGYTPDTISIVPQASLAANTKYRVDIKATVGGDASNVLTSFTTGDRIK